MGGRFTIIVTIIVTILAAGALLSGLASPANAGSGSCWNALLQPEKPASVTHPAVTVTEAPGSALSSDERQAVIALLDELSLLVRSAAGLPLLSLPEGLRIRIGPPGVVAAHDHGEIRISSDFQPTGYRKPPRATRIVLSHEWGHALLDWNLSVRFPEAWQAMERGRAWIADLEKLVFGNRVEINALKRLPPSPERDERLAKLRSGIREAKASLAEERDRQSSYRTIYNPLTELFADAIPVLWLRDGRAARDPVHDAGAGAGAESSRESAELRDFTKRHDVEGWGLEGPYAFFSPTRAWLWENYLSQPRAQAMPALVLDALLDAIGTELKIRFSELDRIPSPEEMNRSLVDRLDAELSERFFP